ncbi:M23 family metallopeptidase [Sorangium sp. So ce381]|uniref:M23 family metallopeptidase n=1 Tax=Sorangium sp. So ce381 TaxID=3133307 RepID=UPI003F5C1382
MSLALGVSFLALLAQGCGSADESAPAGLADEELVGESSHAITAPSNMGNYCSVTWPDGRWAFKWSPANQDPCDDIEADFGGGFTIRRKGLFATTGQNNVVLRCTNWLILQAGPGDAPLDAAFDSASGKSGCVFTVAPVAMPIFDAPFSLSGSYTPVTGFDFARPPYNQLDVSEFGQTGLNNATKVDNKGRDKTTLGFINDHDGYDWLMSKGTDVKAVAAGRVVAIHEWNTGCAGSDSPIQKELLIRHTVYGQNGYYEKFLSLYAHLDAFDVAEGDWVEKGDVIGSVGNNGCSSGAHLHFMAARLTNTADEWEETLLVHQGTAPPHNIGQMTIDPFGFYPNGAGFDPWAFRAFPDGALSINLWNAGQAPSQGSW